jgi:hypothetical protein
MGFDEYGMELAAEMAVMAVIGAETPRQRLYCGDERLKLHRSSQETRDLT